ncbi:MAG: hypothetical protein MJZ84_07660 [Paludibacteraceae bacterium]|nr:hypothetical protein [Paludibacteraceae bacterium]
MLPKVFAEYFQYDGKPYRKRTLIQFGNSLELIGSAILKNPGSAIPGAEPVEEEKIFIQNFYRNNHSKHIDLSKWYCMNINRDTTIKQDLPRLFNGYWRGVNVPLNGVIQLFNCYYYQSANFGDALQHFKTEKKEDTFVFFNEYDELKDLPVYFGWGQNNLLSEKAEEIFNRYIAEHNQHIYDIHFNKNLFAHPSGIKMQAYKNEKYAKLAHDFLEWAQPEWRHYIKKE